MNKKHKSMKRYLSLLFLSIFSFCSFGQIKEKQAIDSIFIDWNKSDVPGCALGIVKKGKLIYANGYGIGDLEHDISITPLQTTPAASLPELFPTRQYRLAASSTHRDSTSLLPPKFDAID
ncbi:MAG: hypothetical protein AAF353_15535 [Pseudomonadota bacterium]